MCHRLQSVLVTTVLFASALGPSRAKADGFSEFATHHANVAARAYLKDRPELKIDTRDFKGTVRVLDREETSIDLAGVSVAGDSFQCQMTVKMDLAVVGKVRVDDELRDLDAELELTVSLKPTLRLKQEKSKITLQPSAELTLLEIQVTDLKKPKKAGREFLTRLANDLAKEHQERIQESIASFLSEKHVTVATDSRRQDEAADNPAIRELIAKAITKELAKYNSKDSPFAKDSGTKKRTKGILRWTEEYSALIWFKSPQNNLTVNLTQFEIQKELILFRAEIKAPVTGNGKARLSRVRASTNASATASLTLSGSAKFAQGKLEDTTISALDGNIADLKFSNDIFDLLRQPLENRANDAIDDKEGDWKEKLTQILNGATLFTEER